MRRKQSAAWLSQLNASPVFTGNSLHSALCLNLWECTVSNTELIARIVSVPFGRTVILERADGYIVTVRRCLTPGRAQLGRKASSSIAALAAQLAGPLHWRAIGQR